MTDQESSPENEEREIMRRNLERMYCELGNLRWQDISKEILKISIRVLKERLGREPTAEEKDSLESGYKKQEVYFERIGLNNPDLRLEEIMKRLHELQKRFSIYWLIIQSSTTEEKKIRMQEFDQEIEDYIKSLPK